ncbi:MAG: hypothetical protein H8D87_00095, partial [Deltaproteobacteria bacterium]|nr:hypothetical protein [Candidatus Desulfobacula maris]
GYEDLVKAGVRLKNQRYSLLRACGKRGYEWAGTKLDSPGDQFALDCLVGRSRYAASKKHPLSI